MTISDRDNLRDKGIIFAYGFIHQNGDEMLKKLNIGRIDSHHHGPEFKEKARKWGTWFQRISPQWSTALLQLSITFQIPMTFQNSANQ